MKITISKTPFLTPQQVGDLASSIDSTHAKVLKAIDRLNNDVAAKKAEIANRWKIASIDLSDRTRIIAQETLVGIRTIRENSKAELERMFKEAGTAYNELTAQKLYYDSPVKVLSRHALGDARRTDYTLQLEHAGSAEIASIGQFAVGTGNVALAAAVLSQLDAMPTNERPFSAPQLALAVTTDFAKVNEYIKIAETRFQGVVLAIRAWTADKANPINTVSLALREREIDQKVLKELHDVNV